MATASPVPNNAFANTPPTPPNKFANNACPTTCPVTLPDPAFNFCHPLRRLVLLSSITNLFSSCGVKAWVACFDWSCSSSCMNGEYCPTSSNLPVLPLKVSFILDWSFLAMLPTLVTIPPKLSAKFWKKPDVWKLLVMVRLSSSGINCSS